MLRLMVKQYLVLERKGITQGYAKVTNPSMVAKFDRLERLAKFRAFQRLAEVRPREFCFDGTFPFKDFDGIIALYGWSTHETSHS